MWKKLPEKCQYLLQVEKAKLLMLGLIMKQSKTLTKGQENLKMHDFLLRNLDYCFKLIVDREIL